MKDRNVVTTKDGVTIEITREMINAARGTLWVFDPESSSLEDTIKEILTDALANLVLHPSSSR